ncbi:MAG: hypothetical protein KKE24_09290 [Candidatus Thermoplasmatota archaeon]|nr:hypothetical protein [Candidatus Thermoplasmatota archaeon]
MTSEQPETRGGDVMDAPEESIGSEPKTAPPTDAGAVQADTTSVQGEEWMEEYEAEKNTKKPRGKIPHLLGISIAVAIVIMLVIWTLLSPQVLPTSGETYLRSPTYANLGNYSGDLDIRWLLNSVHVADTTWGVSIAGSPQVSSGDVVTFDVLITKVNEEMKNPWFVGTSIKVKDAAMFTEDGTQVGTMVGRSSERFGTIAEIEATFDSPGNYTCYVYTEITIYGKMLVGYVPVKVLRMTAYLDADMIVT